MDKKSIYFYLIDTDYSGSEAKLFGLTKSGDRVQIVDVKYRPYFYVVPKQSSNIEFLHKKLKTLKIKYDASVKIERIKKVIKKFNNKNREVLQIFAHKPEDIAKIKNAVKTFSEIEELVEHDINFLNKYMIDKDLVPLYLCRATGNFKDNYFEAIKVERYGNDLLNYKVLGFDIETLSEGFFPDPVKDSIISLGMYSDRFRKVNMWKKFAKEPDFVEFVNSEYEIIDRFKKAVKNRDFQILTGYGSDFFDLKFINTRAKKYDTVLDIGDDGSEIKIIGQGRIKIPGLINIDVSKFVRNLLTLETSRYDLNSVSKAVLGKGKLFSPGFAAKIREYFSIGLADDMKNIAEYNLRDAELSYELGKYVIPNLLEIAKMTSVPLEEINRMRYGRIVEWFLIKNAVREEILVPRRPYISEMFKRKENHYEGGFVYEPAAGLYKNIIVLDFKSLYPTLIASHNIDPHTYNCKCCFLEAGHRVDQNNWFCSKEKGFIPNLINELIERRRRIKKILENTHKDDKGYAELDARQHSLKFIANSTYGYLGFSGSRWYSIECARAITALGRKYIQKVIEDAQKYGFKILYSDTDSCMLLLEDKSRFAAREFLSKVNEKLPRPMELEMQGFYPAGIFLGKKGDTRGAKKRYALLTENGDLVLKGLEAIRGDWSQLARDAQKHVLEIILKEGNAAKAADYLKTLINKVKNREVAKEDLVISVKIMRRIEDYHSEGPHVAAAKQYMAKGFVVNKGFVVKYIIKKGEGRISDRVVLVDDAKPEDYDIDYYVKHQLVRAVYKIFEIFGYSEEKLEKGQTTLESF